MIRRFLYSRLGMAATVSVVLVAFTTWQRSSLRLAAAAAWIAALIILWIAASRTDPRSGPPPPRPPVGPPLSPQAEGIAMLAVILVALAFRFVLLAQLPPFIANDESMFGFEGSWRPDHGEPLGVSLVQAWPRGWFPYLFGFGWNGFPMLSFVVHWLPMMVLGVSNWSLRCGCAAVGMLSIAALYCWARRWWGNVVAVCAALALSINIEHIYWSRLALNNIDAALLSACVLAALAWALDTRSQRAWVALGYALGFGFHTYHSAKLHLLWTALSLLVLASGRRERFSRSDGSGMLLAALAGALVVAPLVPDIVAALDHWLLTVTGRVDAQILVAALLHGNFAAARFYVASHVAATTRLFQPVPVMVGVSSIGAAIALWRWKDPRYRTALLWMGGMLLVGSATIGWRGARLIGAAPVLSLMPALAIAHSRDFLLRYASPVLRGIAAACGVVVLMGALYESWWTVFVWRAQFRNTTFGLCQIMKRLPLPATIYLAGNGRPDEPNVSDALRVCAVPDDPRRHVIRVPPEARSLPEIAEDPNVLVIIFPNRFDLLTQTRQRYPVSFEETYLLNGEDPTVGWVPGIAPCPRGTVGFYAIRLRATCPVAPLLQTHDACSADRRPIETMMEFFRSA